MCRVVAGDDGLPITVPCNVVRALGSGVAALSLQYGSIARANVSQLSSMSGQPVHVLPSIQSI